jgi:heme-degrading monooxygenase HmoA
MHAVVVKVSISDVAGSVKELRETVVPRVAGAPGFVAGYWTRSDDGTNGKSMLVFESEDAAKAAAERIAANVPSGVTFESAEVREVVASA